jgi:hypothetical protein
MKLFNMPFIQHLATSSLLGPDMLLTIFLNTPNLSSSLMLVTRFHTHTKLQVELQFCTFESTLLDG